MKEVKCGTGSELKDPFLAQNNCSPVATCTSVRPEWGVGPSESVAPVKQTPAHTYPLPETFLQQESNVNASMRKFSHEEDGTFLPRVIFKFLPLQILKQKPA